MIHRFPPPQVHKVALQKCVLYVCTYGVWCIHTGTFMSVEEIKSAKILTDSYRTKVSFSLPAWPAVTSKKIDNSQLTDTNTIQQHQEGAPAFPIVWELGGY